MSGGETMIGMWNGSRAAWSGEKKSDPSDGGLPPLADGSRWSPWTNRRGNAVDSAGQECWIDDERLELLDDSFSLQDVRHVIARHDRENGVYWRDRMNALVNELREDADSGRRNLAAASALRIAARRILEELEGVPG
jgi:hypothetical protein